MFINIYMISCLLEFMLRKKITEIPKLDKFPIKKS